MPRTNLDAGLKELQKQMKQIGSRIEDSLSKTLKAVETGNHASLPLIIEADDAIDILCTAAERQTIRLLILQQPLGGQDLRSLTASLHISADLSSIGNAIVEIARTLPQAAELFHKVTGQARYSTHELPMDQKGYLTDAFILRGLLVLGGEIQYILKQAMEAFVLRNAAIAKGVVGERDLVKVRYTPLCEEIMDMQLQHCLLPAPQQDTTYVQRMTYLLWIAHKFAEMATHVADICQRVIFIVEGQLNIQSGP
jgi:phosphate transport system protein